MASELEIWRWKFDEGMFDASANPWRYVSQDPTHPVIGKIVVEKMTFESVIAALEEKFEDGYFEGLKDGKEEVTGYADRFIAAIKETMEGASHA